MIVIIYVLFFCVFFKSFVDIFYYEWNFLILRYELLLKVVMYLRLEKNVLNDKGLVIIFEESYLFFIYLYFYVSYLIWNRYCYIIVIIKD